ncbi:hepatocyte growth factor activator serine proteases-like [Rhipicephalus microplus]|uniref:hepatocyte growth factor activator serine proteases-like n=1 Tax=Rhipicephalus microplus TaxID=6941 RepID=UPI003F6ADDFD
MRPLHLIFVGVLAPLCSASSSAVTKRSMRVSERSLGIPVREGEIPLEAMKFIAPYMNTWPTPADCCANGGTCTHAENGTTRCLCPAAFSGPACLDDVDECLLRKPCGRFSVCINLYGSFRCDCMPGFQRQAHLCVREVSCEEGPCLNGGTCVTRDDLTDVCYCKIGFRGRLCETAVPECSLGTCPGGTFCVSTRRGFRCLRSLRDLRPGYRLPWK